MGVYCGISEEYENRSFLPCSRVRCRCRNTPEPWRNHAPSTSEIHSHVVSEADSPIQQAYIKGKDGLYIAAAIRKPKGDARYPAIIIFHGAPGGRGMEQLARWSRGDHGGPVWNVSSRKAMWWRWPTDRGGNMNLTSAPSSTGMITSIDDGLSVIDYVKALPYVDPEPPQSEWGQPGRQPGYEPGIAGDCEFGNRRSSGGHVVPGNLDDSWLAGWTGSLQGRATRP